MPFTYTVNSENFARILFSRKFIYSFVKIKSSRNGKITLLITDLGILRSSYDFLASQICLLTHIVKIKFSRKFPDLQYSLLNTNSTEEDRK